MIITDASGKIYDIVINYCEQQANGDLSCTANTIANSVKTNPLITLVPLIALGFAGYIIYIKFYKKKKLFGKY